VRWKNKCGDERRGAVLRESGTGLVLGGTTGSSDFRFPHTSRSSQHLDEGLSSWLLRPKARFDELKLFVLRFVIAVSSLFGLLRPGGDATSAQEREITRAASRALPAGSEIVTRSQVPSSPSAVISSLFICCGLHFVRFVSSLCKNEQTCCSKKHRSTSVSPERSHE
jgi:hypothetical protein